MTTPGAKRLVTRPDELAQSLPPPRDLWPAIAAAIEAEAAAAAPAVPRRRSFWMPAAGMAAAVALVAIGVLIGRALDPVHTGTGTLAGTTHAGDPAMRPATLRDAEYREQREALMTEVNSRLQTMPEEERKKVAASLATLQRSISEIEAALGRDPANALLQELLVSSCQEEMRALTAVRDSGSQEI
jgi:hypothetical protein